MKKINLLLTVLLLNIFHGLGQPNTNKIEAEHYKTKKFDVAIFPENYIDMIPGERFTPTKQDIDKAEVALIKGLKKLNRYKPNQASTPVIHKNLRKYKRQYFGYIDKNGQRILLINCFWDEDLENHWLKERVQVFDGGSYYWNIQYNIDKNKLFDLYVNGYA